jgi:predicted ArsR family transcriptional regulator
MAARKHDVTTDGMRLRTARMVLDALLKLSVRSYTYQELASSLGIGYKTSLRYVSALEAIGIPIVQDQRESEETGRSCQTFRVDRDWARRMLKVESDATR